MNLTSIEPSAMNRRHVLQGSAAVAAASGLVAVSRQRATAEMQELALWSDPETWGGAVPGTGQVAAFDKPVLLDRDASVAGVDVGPNGRLVFHPTRSVTLRSTGNVTIAGRLEMRPTTAQVEHVLRFAEVDESRFQGGGHEIMASDVGLWIHHDGVADLHGTPRTAWVRAAHSLHAEATTLRLQVEPTGWRVGDELVIAPTGSPVDGRHYEKFDHVRIRSISGTLVKLDGKLRHGHPAIDVGDGHRLTAEILNLTRNVRVEGTPDGRTHAMALHAMRPSEIRFAAFRHFGPRQPDSEGISQFVLGRYGFHWHMCGDGSAGSIMDGVVMRDGGSHAFVTHLSNGVRHRSCISFDTAETPYWWDGAPDTRSPAPSSHDVIYEQCVAALVRAIPEYRGIRLAGFDMAEGRRNAARGCISVGVRGNIDSNGFHWPEGAHSVWEFSDCVAHNNAGHGIFAWQNDGRPHRIAQFIGYHNGRSGISHGAYQNAYHYRDVILFGNAESGLLLHAVGRRDRRLRFDNLLIDCAGQAAFAVESVQHRLPPEAPTQITGSRLRNYTRHGIAVTGDASREGHTARELLDVIGCDFSGSKFWLGRGTLRGTRVRFRGRRRSLLLRRRGTRGGRLARRWNARVHRIPRFGRRRNPRRIEIRVGRRAPM